MGKKSPAPPPPPDYTGAAIAQGQANLESARTTARLSNPNIVTPFGSQTVTYGRDVFDEAGFNRAMEQYRQQQSDFEARKAAGVMAGGPMGGFGDLYGGYREGAFPFEADIGAPPVAPTREQFTTRTDLDTPTVTQTLSPEQQKILEAEQRVQLGLSGLGETALGTAQRVIGQPFQPNLRDLSTTLTGYGQVAGAPNLTGMGQARADVAAGALPDLALQGQARADVSAGALPALALQGQARADVSAGALPDLALQGRARARVGPGRVSFGPTEGQYGFAQGGVGVPQLRAFQPEGLPELRGVSAEGLPSLRGEVTPQAVSGQVGPLQQQTTLGQGQAVQFAPDLGMFGLARGDVSPEQLQRGFDTRGLAAMPVAAGTTGQQAILSRVMPQIQEQRQRLETQLANQGIPRGSEAYNSAIREQQQQENDAIQQAALQGLQLDMAARQQGFQEAQAAAQFANQAALGQFGMGAQVAGLQNQAIQQNVQTALAGQQAQNVAQQQDFAQRVAAGEFGNAAQQALFGAGMQQAQFGAQAAGQNFQQQLAAQQFANQARAQGMDERQIQAALAGQQRGQLFGEQQTVQQAFNQAGLQQQQAALANQDAYNRAVQQNLAAGLNIQQAQNAASQQLFGQQMAAQQLQNQAVAQNQATTLEAYRARLAGQQQGFGQQVAAQQLQNQAVAQNQATALEAYSALLAGQQQGFGQQVAAQQLQNQAIAQNQATALEAYRALLAGQQQGFGQQMDVQAAQNAALAQNQAIAAQQQQLANAAQAQQFNQALQGAQFGNTALQQSLQQQLALRNQPINEIAALMSGVQVQAPQFQGYTGANVAAAPLFGATQAAGDFAQRNYGNQVGAYNARMGLLGSLAGAAGTAAGAGLFSDRRLKSRIVRVGTHPLGIGIYEYDIFGERQRGVMADEVESVLPAAVTEHSSGFKMVNYGMLQ